MDTDTRRTTTAEHALDTAPALDALDRILGIVDRHFDGMERIGDALCASSRDAAIIRAALAELTEPLERSDIETIEEWGYCHDAPGSAAYREASEDLARRAVAAKPGRVLLRRHASVRSASNWRVAS